MKREFTQREKVLLLILAVVLLVCGYVKFFDEPLRARQLSAQDRLVAAEDEILIESTKASELQRMQAELKALKSSGAVQTAEIPEYNNLDRVMVQLDSILSRATDYELTFRALEFGEELVSRPVELTFTAPNYAAAREILTSLHNCRYRCALSNLSVTAEKDDVTAQTVTVEATVTFFEKSNQAALADSATQPTK